MGWRERVAERWEEVLGERERHRRHVERKDEGDEALNELMARAEEKKAEAMRRAAGRRESRSGPSPDKLHRLADDAEAKANLFREMGLEQEEYEVLTESEDG